MEDYNDQYFIFSVNCPDTRRVYGEEVLERNGVLFQKRDLLIPIGIDTIGWMNVSTDQLPRLEEDIIPELLRREVKQAFTTSLVEYPNASLWGLSNLYAPSEWNYELDKFPPAEIYFSLGRVQRELFFKNGIEVLEVRVNPVNNT